MCEYLEIVNQANSARFQFTTRRYLKNKNLHFSWSIHNLVTCLGHSLVVVAQSGILNLVSNELFDLIDLI